MAERLLRDIRKIIDFAEQFPNFSDVMTQHLAALEERLRSGDAHQNECVVRITEYPRPPN